MRAWLTGLIAFLLIGSATAAQTPKGVGGSVNGAVVWVPDYYARYVLIDTFDADGNLSTAKIPVADKACNPNALTVAAGSLYVVCNSDFGGSDQILVYDAKSLSYVKTIGGTDANGADYFTGSSLTGILFDAKGNLWTTGYASNTLLRVPKPNLGEADPHIDREVIDSPDSPAGLALDSDKSVWVVGQYQGGIVVNFTNAVLPLHRFAVPLPHAFRAGEESLAVF
jgi:streptogramin lyase